MIEQTLKIATERLKMFLEFATSFISNFPRGILIYVPSIELKPRAFICFMLLKILLTDF